MSVEDQYRALTGLKTRPLDSISLGVAVARRTPSGERGLALAELFEPSGFGCALDADPSEEVEVCPRGAADALEGVSGGYYDPRWAPAVCLHAVPLEGTIAAWVDGIPTEFKLEVDESSCATGLRLRLEALAGPGSEVVIRYRTR